MANHYMRDKRLSLRDKGLMNMIVRFGKELMEEDDAIEMVTYFTADYESNVLNAFGQLKKYGYFGRFKNEDGKYTVFINELTEDEDYE